MKNFFNKSKKIVLDKNSKDKIREKITAFARENPLYEHKPTRWAHFLLAMPTQFKYQTALLYMIIFVFATIFIASVKADQSLPGELLYPMKIGINEHIKQTLIFSEQKKNKIYIECVEIRLQEAESILLRGDISDEVKTQLQEGFKEHFKKARGRISTIKNSEEKEKIIIELEVVLETHRRILASLPLEPSQQKLEPLLKTIEDAQKNLLLLRLELDKTN